jgi:hypothetical protein
MKRNFMLVCVSALVLALGLSSSAVASAEVGANPAAKKGTKKGKACKKGKAGKSTATAQAKKKGKGKPCKGKPKSKGTTTTPQPTPPAPPAAAPLSDGTYGDPTSLLELKVSAGTVVLKYVPPGFCAGLTYTSQPVPFTKSGDTWMANENRSFSLIGEPAVAKWDLAVKDPGLTYALNFTLESNTMIGPCKGEGHPTGTLVKVG